MWKMTGHGSRFSWGRERFSPAPLPLSLLLPERYTERAIEKERENERKREREKERTRERERVHI